MNQYREILRLHSQGISQRNITVSCACSRNAVSKIIQRAEEVGIAWPLEKDLSDGELRQRLFAEVEKQPSRKHPDYEYIHREMAKSGVTGLSPNVASSGKTSLGEQPLPRLSDLFLQIP
jgi:hypothetical protein